MADTPQIHIRREGPFFRAKIEPAHHLQPGIARPETYASHISASSTAAILQTATCFVIIDHTLAGR